MCVLRRAFVYVFTGRNGGRRDEVVRAIYIHTHAHIHTHIYTNTYTRVRTHRKEKERDCRRKRIERYSLSRDTEEKNPSYECKYRDGICALRLRGRLRSGCIRRGCENNDSGTSFFAAAAAAAVLHRGLRVGCVCENRVAR